MCTQNTGSMDVVPQMHGSRTTGPWEPTLNVSAPLRARGRGACPSIGVESGVRGAFMVAVELPVPRSQCGFSGVALSGHVLCVRAAPAAPAAPAPVCWGPVE